MKKHLLNFSRYFVGILFIVSGLIKANDPVGFGIKLEEYYEVFHLDSLLGSTATFQAILICGIEIICGILLVLGIKAVQNAWVLLWMIAFFTFLTFVSAVFKVVTSCGCFGDAIPLSPWQSFGKDVILLIFITIIFRGRKQIQPHLNTPKAQNMAIVSSVLFGLGVGVYTYTFLPVIDFLPYKVGANIPSLMRIPEGASQDEYQMIYTLKHIKTGEQKTMTDKQYIETGIYNDNKWEIYGEPEKKLIKKGYQAPISDLIISDETGADYTNGILENPYYNFIVVASNLQSIDDKAMQELSNLSVRLTGDFNVRMIGLTANSVQDADKYSAQHRIKFEFFFVDAVPLKSMVRANPGVLLLKNGTIQAKWSMAKLPSYNTLRHKFLEEK